MSSVTEVGKVVSSSNVTSIATSPTQTLPIGSLVFLAITLAANVTAPSVTDSQGNTYTQSDRETFNASNFRLFGYFSVLTTALTTSDTWTFAPSAGATVMGFQAFLVGSPNATPFDVSNGTPNQTTTTPVTGTTGTLAQAVEMVFACYAYQNSPSFTAPAGFSQTGITAQVTDGSGQISWSVAYLETAATTALNPQATLGTSQHVTGMFATFKVSAGGGGTTHTLSLAVSQSSSVVLGKTPRKVLAVSASSTPTLSVLKAAVRSFAVSQSQSLTLSKLPSRVLKVTQSSTLTFVSSNAILRTFAVTQAQAVALAKQAARVFAVSQSSTVVKEQATVAKTMAVSQSQSVTLAKIPGKTFATTATSTPSFVGSLAHLRTFAVSQAQSVALVKSQAITLRASATATVTTARRAARSFLVSAAQTVSVVLQKSGALVGRLFPFDAPNPEAGSFDDSSPTARTLRPK